MNMLQSNNRRTAHLLEREKEEGHSKTRTNIFHKDKSKEWESKRMRESMQKYLQKGKCKSGCWPHCLTFLEKTSTHAYLHKIFFFNLTSGSPCTAKAREIDRHREKQSKTITVKTGKQLKRAKGWSISSNDLQKIDETEKSQVMLIDSQ